MPTRILSSLIAVLSLLFVCAGIPAVAGQWTESVLHSFGDGSVKNDGLQPYAGLVQASDGNLYGTTTAGGSTETKSSAGDGALFRITTSGTVTILHSFDGGSATDDGIGPYASLIRTSGGDLYGVTSKGGAGFGTIFDTTLTGDVQDVHYFADGTVASDGEYAYKPLVLASDGNFYGTTESGGTQSDGAIIRMTPDGVVTVVHSFMDGTVANDGNQPCSGLIEGSDGNLYGTTYLGGSANEGVVYRMTLGGVVTTLHSFQDGSVLNDGAYPDAELVQAVDGDYYGTTYEGGSASEGAVFRMTSSGSVTTLHSFGDGSVASDGAYPESGLLQASDGDFYGATTQGGSASDGAIFCMAPSGAAAIVHPFGSTTGDGASPRDTLIEASDGNLYGTTAAGGTKNEGTVFKVSGVAPAPSLYFLKLSAARVAGELSVTGTIILTAVAPADGYVVDLSSSNPSVAAVPSASITIPAGAIEADFTVTTTPVLSPASVAISATANSATLTATIIVDVPMLKSIAANPQAVLGGSPSTVTITLNGPVYADKIVALSSSSDAAVIPRSVTIAKGQSSATFGVTTTVVSATAFSKLSATLGPKTLSTKLTVNQVDVSSAQLAQTTVLGGGATTLTIDLSAPAPADTVVGLSSNNAAVTLPASVTIPQGQSSTTVNVATSAVSKNVVATIAATFGDSAQTAKLTVDRVDVESAGLAPTSVVGGDTATLTVTLSAPAPADTIVGLSSGNTSVSVPASVTIAPGQTSAQVSVATTSVKKTTAATLTARLGQSKQTAALTITP
jgi:uncharacterized repeat protein (TIGR03803 family)